MKRLLAILLTLALVYAIPSQAGDPCAAEYGQTDAAGSVPAWPGGEWRLNTIHLKTLSKDSPCSIDSRLNLNGFPHCGDRLVLADGTVDTDIDLNELLEDTLLLPFSVPELELTAYDSYSLDGDTLRLAPGDIEMTVGYENDALSLTYLTHVEIRSQHMAGGPPTQPGESDLKVILRLVPVETTDPVEEPAEEPAEGSTEPSPEPSPEISAEYFRHADAGQTRVEWNGGEESFELELFASQWTNWDLLVNTIPGGLMPGSGVYLFVLRIRSLSEPLTYDRIKNEIAPTLALRSKADGTQDLPNNIVLPFDAEDGEPVWCFDLVYNFRYDGSEDDFELLYDGVLYPLSGLPKDGYALTVPSPSPTPSTAPSPIPSPTATSLPVDIAALNELHRQAISENGTTIDKAVCTGDVVVAYYFSGGENVDPYQVLTADSDDTWDFPRKYRAKDYESARWAAIIYPTYVHVGWYGTIAAYRTITWLSLFDLETGVHYEEKVATEEPPRTVTVQSGNGFTRSSETSGEFHAAAARARLTELVEAARQRPTSTPEPTP
ncbi:MAG: hypothetical protein IJJ45_02660 [Clostridia bacterium]|nr:hypothetical protein [Clostridia bacterium]